jgi:hypothetical protein
MDWSFMVWQAGSRQRPRRLPPDINPRDAEGEPPAQIDVYTGGNIKWADVVVPPGLKIVDRRLEAHGFKLADGVVLEGKVADLTTGQPLAAKVRLEVIEPQKTGGYRYSAVANTVADAAGRWVVKKTPAGWLRTGERYESALLDAIKTDAAGRFRSDQVPVGKATVWIHKPGYCRSGLGLPITTPKEDVELSMIRAARVVVTVDFTGKERPPAYIVHMEPEGGEAVGKYGGSGHINDKNQITFDDVPPARYVLRGNPNPSSGDQRTEAVTVELKGGKTAEVTLNAK